MSVATCMFQQDHISVCLVVQRRVPEVPGQLQLGAAAPAAAPAAGGAQPLQHAAAAPAAAPAGEQVEAKKRRRRRKADPSAGISWTALTLELVDSYCPRDGQGRFVQLSTVLPAFKAKYEAILTAVCLVASRSLSAQGEGVTSPAVR